MSSYLLHHTNVIIPYNIDHIIEAIALKPHGKSKSKKTFWPIMHSLKEHCKVKVLNDSRAIIYIIDDFENAEKYLGRHIDSVVLRKSHQIYNVQLNVSKNKTKEDAVLNFIAEMLKVVINRWIRLGQICKRTR